MQFYVIKFINDMYLVWYHFGAHQKRDHHNIAELLLKVALKTNNPQSHDIIDIDIQLIESINVNVSLRACSIFSKTEVINPENKNKSKILR